MANPGVDLLNISLVPSFINRLSLCGKAGDAEINCMVCQFELINWTVELTSIVSIYITSPPFVAYRLKDVKNKFNVDRDRTSNAYD